MKKRIPPAWVADMIQNESTPKEYRNYPTIEEFCKKYDISIATYYYQASKKDNQSQIIEKCLRYANNSTPEILEVLRDKAKQGDNKAIEMHLEYISKLSKKIDVTSKGESISTDDILKRLNEQARKTIKR